MSKQIGFGGRLTRVTRLAVVMAATLAATAAQAAIVKVNFTGNPLSFVPFNIDGVYLNLVTGAATAPSSNAGYDINPYFTGTSGASPSFRFYVPSTGGIIATGTIATPLAEGTVIGSGSTFANGGAVFNPNSANTDIHYFGFRFVNESTASTNYGYIAIQQMANPPVAGSVQILGYAFENTGASLAVSAISAVPEPSSALLMLGGLAVAVGLRRRMKAQAV